MKVQEGNVLIANFMGVNPSNWNASHKRIDYDNSWNKLMPVFQKLFTIKVVTSERLHWGRRFGIVRRVVCDGEDIKVVFEKIVIAIQYYNSQVHK